MAQFHWDPAGYLALMRDEVPDYELLQDEAVAATGDGAQRILELGTGTGETTRRVLERHPAAAVVGVDASAGMLAQAHTVLAPERVDLRRGHLEEALPDGPFDVVVSVLAVHHLDGDGKADLFRRVAAVLAPGGRFVLGDVVVPSDPADVVTPIDGDYDKPSSIDDQLAWLAGAGLSAELRWARRDLAVIAGRAPAAG